MRFVNSPYYYSEYDWVQWNRSRVSASLADVEPVVSTENVGESVLEWTEMNVKAKPVSGTSNGIGKKSLRKLLNKVGI